MGKRISDLPTVLSALSTDQLAAARSGESVQLTLAQIQTLIENALAVAASNVSIADAGGFYSSSDVEGALQELGPIETTGSNSNGEYLVFSSGVQICMGRKNINAYPDTITLPVAFANTEYFLVPTWYNNSAANAGRTVNERRPASYRSATTFQVYAYSAAGSGSSETSGTIEYIAIGETS